MEENKNFIEGGEINPFYFNLFLEKESDTFSELKTITPEQIEDIYNVYISKEYLYSEETEENRTWAYLLKKFDKGYLKFLSNNNRGTTEIVSKILSKKIDKILQEIKEEEEQQQKGQGEGKNPEKGEGSPLPVSSELDQKIDSQINQIFDEIEQEIKEAQEEQKKEQEETVFGKNAGNGNTFRYDADEKTVINLLNRVNFNSRAINDFITQTIKRFRGHFGNISKIEIEDLFNSQDIDDLDGLEFLPVIDEFPFLWQEVINVTKNQSVVVDIYVDFSGSTDCYCNLLPTYNSFKNTGKAENVRMIDLEKVLAYHLYQNKYVADIYGFQYNPYKMDINNFLKSNTGGGTCIDNSIRLVQKTCNPSLIITDGNDKITEYSDLVYIINVDPHSAHSMMNHSSSVLQKYIEKNQILAFVDGMFMTKSRLNDYKRGL